MRVSRQSAAIPARTLRRDGRKTGTGAPAQASTRTSARSASLGEEIAQHDRLPVATESEARLEVPAREVDVRSGSGDLVGEPRERERAVDEHLHLAPCSWRRSRRPRADPPGESGRASDPLQPALVMPLHAARNQASEQPIGSRHDLWRLHRPLRSADPAVGRRSPQDLVGDTLLQRVQLLLRLQALLLDLHAGRLPGRPCPETRAHRERAET